MNNLYLKHHGILGQKWGVRRYQNYDGTRTELGKKQEKYRRRTIRAGKTMDDVNDIVRTFNETDRARLGMGDGSGNDDYMTYLEGSHVVKRVIKRDGDMPVAFFDLLEDEYRDGTKFYNTVIAVRSGNEYRGKGYATEVAKAGMDWYEKNADKLEGKEVIWGVRKDNEGSIKIAKKLGFEKYSEDGDWVNYVKKH